MKISILGYCGSGKSTLAQVLGQTHGIPVFHFDCVHWLPGWIERSREETGGIVKQFLEENKSWVMDGNYSRHHLQRRLEESDKIVLLLFGRFTCLRRAIKRYRTYKGKTRISMTEGCPEKLDWAFIKWILWQGRSRKHKELYRNIQEQYPEKCTVLKNQNQLDAYIKRSVTYGA